MQEFNLVLTITMFVALQWYGCRAPLPQAETPPVAPRRSRGLSGAPATTPATAHARALACSLEQALFIPAALPYHARTP